MKSQESSFGLKIERKIESGNWPLGTFVLSLWVFLLVEKGGLERKTWRNIGVIFLKACIDHSLT